LAGFLISSRVNGPGRRFVIWFQGCSIRCRGCLNPEFHDEDGGHLIETARLVDMIRDLRDEIEGVTFTGGEPLAQAMELVSLPGLLSRWASQWYASQDMKWMKSLKGT